MNAKKDVSIIIPFYNECEENINNLSLFTDYFKNQPFTYEIIVVNDGSIHNNKLLEDKIATLEDIKYIYYSENKGKGYAVNTGIKESVGNHIFFADADHATPIKYFADLYQHKDTHSAMIGSRHLRKGSIVTPQPPFRRFISWCARLIIRNLITKRSIKDSQCGFKMFESSLAKSIAERQTIFRWGFDVEILAITVLDNHKIKEVPVEWHHGPISQVKALPASWNTFIEVLRIKRNLLQKRYNEK